MVAHGQTQKQPGIKEEILSPATTQVILEAGGQQTQSDSEPQILHYRVLGLYETYKPSLTRTKCGLPGAVAWKNGRISA